MTVFGKQCLPVSPRPNPKSESRYAWNFCIASLRLIHTVRCVVTQPVGPTSSNNLVSLTLTQLTKVGMMFAITLSRAHYAISTVCYKLLLQIASCELAFMLGFH